MRKILLGFTLILTITIVQAQTIRERIEKNPALAYCNGHVYPVEEIKPQTLSPKGYKPFYISHYARHGSRCFIEGIKIKHLIERFERVDSLGLLTPLGKKVLEETRHLYEIQSGSFAMLTDVGRKQHQGIAKRMYENYPEIFSEGCSIDSKSSKTKRSVESMEAFNAKLLELVPSMHQSMTHAAEVQLICKPQSSKNHLLPKEFFSKRDDYYSSKASNGWTREQKDFYHAANMSGAMSRLFTDVKKAIKATKTTAFHLSERILTIVIFSANLGYDNSELIKEVFSTDELLSIYSNYSFKWFSRNACTDDEVCRKYISLQRILINDIIDNTQSAIDKKNGCCGNFRFGHDNQLVVLASALGLEGCAMERIPLKEAVQKYIASDIIPMAGNIQMVCYRKGKKVLVKFLLNENEKMIPQLKSSTAPYYKWEDVKKYLLQRMKDFAEDRTK
ncbi:MAG: histidine-type phosphatase [Alistipes sp.]|nr:histidine-type phosphatase [Candidatus Alistipes equi]